MKIRNLFASFFLIGFLLAPISFALPLFSPTTGCPQELSETNVNKDPVLMDKNGHWMLLNGIDIPGLNIKSSGFVFLYNDDPIKVRKKAKKLIRELMFDRQESTTGACYYVYPNDPEKSKFRAAYLLLH